MTAADDNNLPEQAAGAGGPGAMLAAAREQQGLSLEGVAHELHLDMDIVRAVEEENFGALGAPVFVKGYLRGYARLLGLPEQEIVDAWQPEDHDTDAFRTLSLQTEVKPGASLPMFVLWVALGVLILVALVYLLSGDDESAEQPEPEFIEEATPQPVLSEPVVQKPAVVVPPREQDFVVLEEAVVEAPPPEPEPVKPQTVDLRLAFSEECWVEVSDSGRRLLYGLEKAGSVRSFAAEPPLRFFIGNVAAVDIQLSGQQYDIPANVRTGRNTARFVVSADDVKGLQ